MPALRQLFAEYLRSSKSFGNSEGTSKHRLVDLRSSKSTTYNTSRPVRNTTKASESDEDILVGDGIVQARSFTIDIRGTNDPVHESFVIPKNLQLPEQRV